MLLLLLLMLEQSRVEAGWREKGAWSLGGGSMPRAVEIAVPRISILQHGVCTLYYAYRMRSWLTRGLGYSA